MAAPKFHELTISAIRPQTAHGLAISFAVPPELAETFEFTPGQYLTLRADVDSNDIRRSYSICSAQQDTHLEVGIKQVENGAFSNYATTLSVGDVLKVMPPQGRFVAKSGGQNNYLLVAAGSGITPCLSIAKSTLQGKPDSTVTLIYGNSHTNTVMFREDIDALKDRYTDRFNLIHVLSQEQRGIDFLFGRIDQSMIETLTEKGMIEPSVFDAAYLCGPQTLAENVATALEAAGMGTEKIKTELFAASHPAANTAGPAKTAPSEGVPVSIVLDGTENIVTVDGANETVLAAAQRAGMDLPFSCAGGMCCTCRCKIVDGESQMDVNYSLQDWEVEAGFTLACQTRPKSVTLKLDFDAA